MSTPSRPSTHILRNTVDTESQAGVLYIGWPFGDGGLTLSQRHAEGAARAMEIRRSALRTRDRERPLASWTDLYSAGNRYKPPGFALWA